MEGSVGECSRTSFSRAMGDRMCLCLKSLDGTRRVQTQGWRPTSAWCSRPRFNSERKDNLLNTHSMKKWPFHYMFKNQFFSVSVGCDPFTLLGIIYRSSSLLWLDTILNVRLSWMSDGNRFYIGELTCQVPFIISCGVYFNSIPSDLLGQLVPSCPCSPH